ncbi:hydrophobin 2 [Cladorrhinum sp. PSN332]|nr:hydrophobin 2 [Cladorrhinum sp. PSN332]
MKLTTATSILLAAAIQSGIGFAQQSVCRASLYSNPQCCGGALLGVAALDCGNPTSAASLALFRASCANVGKTAYCCAIPVAGQSLLCAEAV